MFSRFLSQALQLSKSISTFLLTSLLIPELVGLSAIYSTAKNSLHFYLKKINRLPAFVIIALLVGSQISFTSLSLLTPFIQQKSAMSSLMKMLNLDKIKAEATPSTAVSSSSSTGATSSSSATSSKSSVISSASSKISSASSTTTSTSANSNSAASSQSSSVLSWSSYQPMVVIPTFVGVNFGVNQSVDVAVKCVDSSDDGTFSLIIGYGSNQARKEITASALSPNRPVIHTHFDRLDKNALDFNDPNITTKLSGPITYFKGTVGQPTSEEKAMVIQGQGDETVKWEFTVDGKNYVVGANKTYATKCVKPTVQTIDGNNPANLTPPIDPKYVVYEYSNIFNNDSNYFLATENEYSEAGSKVKFYSKATRDFNKPTSLWYYDTNTFQIKSKVNNMCLHKEQYKQLEIQICNTKDLAQQFEIAGFNNDVTKPQLKLKPSTKCFDFNLFAQDLNGAATIQESGTCDGNIKQNISFKKGTGTEAVGTPTTYSTFAPTQFKLQLVDCLANAKLYFTDAIAEGRNSDNTVTSVRVKFQGTDRIVSCEDIVRMQSLDLTTTSNPDIDNNLSLYNMIKIRGGMNFLDTMDGSGLDGTIAVTGRNTYDRTKKSQNWFYDTETQQIKSAYVGKCLSLVASGNEGFAGLYQCSTDNSTRFQKWKIIKNTNQNYVTAGGDSLIQLEGTPWCLAGELMPQTTNGITVLKDDYWLAQRMVLRDCLTDKAVDYGSQLIEIISKIDTRDISLIALENDRLQRLYNGATPAKDTSTFGSIEHISGLGILSADTTFNVKIDNNSKVFLRPTSPNFRQNWKYNSTTKQVYLDRDELCLGQDIFQTVEAGVLARPNAIKCSTLDNKQMWNVMKMTDGNYMIQSVLNKGCIDKTTTDGYPVTRLESCGTGKWKGGIGNYSTTFPVVKVSIPLINILSDIKTNGKKWTLDVKAGVTGDNSELFMWESTTANTNQMFAFNPETNEIYYNPSRTTEATNQKVVITDPEDAAKKIEVPVFVRNFSEAMTCVDAGNGVFGTSLRVSTCNGKLSQKWSFESTLGSTEQSSIKNLSQNFCVEAEQSLLNITNQMTNGRKVIIAKCNFGINQKFRKYEKGGLLAKNNINKDIAKTQLTNFELINSIIDPITVKAVQPPSPLKIDPLSSQIVNPKNNACFTDIKLGKLTCSIPENTEPKISTQTLEKTTINTKNTTTGKSDSIKKFLEKNTKNTKKITKSSSATTSSTNSTTSNAKLNISSVTNQSIISTPTDSNTPAITKPDNMLVDPNNLPDSIKAILEKSSEAKIARITDSSSKNSVLTFLDNLNPFKNISANADAPTVGIYEIQLLQISNWVMDINNQSSANGTKVQLWNRNNTSAQKWLWNTGTGEIKGIAGKCLDSGGGNLGDTLRIHDCHGGWNQKWAFKVDYTLTQANPNMGRNTCVSIQSTDAYNGANLIMNDCSKQNEYCSYFWNYTDATGYDRTRVPKACGGTDPAPTPTPQPQQPSTEGINIVANLFNKNSVFDIYGGSSANQTAVTLYNKSGSINQKFRYFSNTDEIKALAGKCLDSGSGSRGDWIRINDCTGSWNQKFVIKSDYSISQRNSNNGVISCIGNENGATNGSPRLVLKDCSVNDCSTYWEMENTGGYVPSSVYAQGCGSFTTGGNNNNTTPSTPPSYTPPTPPAPTPSPQPQPVPTPSPVPTPTFPADYIEPINESGIINALNSEYEVSATAESANISGKLNNSVTSFGLQQWKLTGAVNKQCLLWDGGCNSEWALAFLNSLLIITNFIIGLIGGAFLFIGDTFQGIVDFLKSLPDIKKNIGGILQNIGQLNDVNVLSSIFIKYGSASSQSVYDVIDEFDNADIYTKWQIIGIKTAFVLLTVVGIYKTIASLVGGFSNIVSKAKSLAIGSANIASSLLNNAGVFRFGKLVINGARNVGNSIRIKVSEVVRVIKEGNSSEINKLGLNKTTSFEPLSSNSKCQIICKPVIFDDIQIQKKFKHAIDFGINGNFDSNNSQLFKNSIQSFVNSNTKIIGGKYRGQLADIHFNYTTGQAIVLTSSGGFWTGWKLSPAQYQAFTNTLNMQ